MLISLKIKILDKNFKKENYFNLIYDKYFFTI